MGRVSARLLEAGGGFIGAHCQPGPALLCTVCAHFWRHRALCWANVLGYKYILTFPILFITSTFPLPFLGCRNLSDPLKVKTWSYKCEPVDNPFFLLQFL